MLETHIITGEILEKERHSIQDVLTFLLERMNKMEITPNMLESLEIQGVKYTIRYCVNIEE